MADNNHPFSPEALLVTSDFPPAFGGGISRHYHCLSVAAQGRIAVLAPKGPESAAFDFAQPFAIHRQVVPLARSVPSRLLQTSILAVRAATITRRTIFRALLFGHWYLAVAGPILERSTGTRFAVFLHGGELDRLRRGSVITRAAIGALDRADAVIVNSDHTRDEYLRQSSRPTRIVKINPGVDVTRFCPQAKPPEIVRRHELEGKRVLLTVGRLVERKGHDLVLRALDRIAAQVPEAVYLIVGSGPMEGRLRGLAGQLGVSGRVIFAGQVAEAELPAYYNVCDVFLMPSRQTDGREAVEGFGIVYLEAGACGKPAIGGLSGGVREAVVDGVSGFLVDPSDSAFLADRVVQLLLNKELAAGFGDQARRRAEKEFGWSIQAERLQQLLAGL